jgi:hypothetical protein
MNSQIYSILDKLSAECQSVNQTLTSVLRMCPIAINIETKVPFSGEETADVQLAVWTGAGLMRTRQFLTANNRAKTQIPNVPMLQMHGHDVHLLILEEQEDKNVSWFLQCSCLFMCSEYISGLSGLHSALQIFKQRHSNINLSLLARPFPFSSFSSPLLPPSSSPSTI